LRELRDEGNTVIIADHDPVQVVEKLKNKYSETWNTKLEFFPDKPGWTPTHSMTTWLPFGYMCLRSIAAKYDDSGVTDDLQKHQVGLYNRARLGWREKHGNN
jgi:hypothetical protein